MIIETTIKTQQFIGKDKWDYTEQSGTISDITWFFEPNYKYHKGRIGPHKVHFKNREEWMLSKIK